MSSKEDADISSTYDRKAQATIFLLKLVEMGLIILCIGLIDDPVNHQFVYSRPSLSMRTISLCYATFVAFLLYSVILLTVKLFGETYSWKSGLIWAFIGFILFLLCSVFLFRDWSIAKERNYWHPNTTRLDFICAVASISLVTSVIYLIDLVLTGVFGARGKIE